MISIRHVYSHRTMTGSVCREVRGRAVVLLSGGLDSATTLAICLAEGFEAHALSFSYGQRHEIELESARRVAATLGAASHTIMSIDLRSIGGSALTDDLKVPKDQTLSGG